MSRPPLDSSEAEIETLNRLCERLAGFDERVSLEWLDGAMTALATGPRSIAPSEWLPVLLGDAWSRTFADPQDEGEATAALAARAAVIASQLDAQSLLDAPDTLRLAPLIAAEPDAQERERLVAEGRLSEAELAELPRTGEIWALGFLEAVEAFPEDWPEPDSGADDAFVHEDALRCIVALALQDAAELEADLAQRYPGQALSRDEVIDEACFAVQDLRVYWLDHAPRPPTRRVEPGPGRNDPCPCGSGRKFKKCHGATDAG